MCKFRYYIAAFLMLSCLSLAYAAEDAEKKCPEGQVFDEVTKMCKDIPSDE